MAGLHGVEAFQGKFLEDVQGHERCDALAVRRYFPQFAAAVAHADGVYPLGLEGRQVRGREVAVKGGAFCCYTGRQVAAVKIFGAALGYGLQAAGVVGQAHNFARQRGPSLGRKSAVPGGKFRPGAVFPQGLEGFAPQKGQHGRHGVALTGVGDGRFQQRGEGQFAEPGGECGPGPHRARHGHGRPAVARHGGAAVAGQNLFDGNGLGRGAAGIEPVQGVVLPDQGKGVATQAVGGGLQHGEGCGRGHNGVHGIAALAQHGQTRRGGQGGRSGHHAVAGVDGYSAGRVGRVKGVKIKGMAHGGTSWSCGRPLRHKGRPCSRKAVGGLFYLHALPGQAVAVEVFHKGVRVHLFHVPDAGLAPLA